AECAPHEPARGHATEQLLRGLAHPVRRRAARRKERGGGAARPQRRRQEHHAQELDRHGDAAHRLDCARWRRARRQEEPRDRPGRHAARARGAPHLRQPQRRGAPGARWPLGRIYEMFPRLRDRRTSRGTDLSGGEQQMLAIARGLIRDPKIILLDEPFEGLAPIIVRDLLATCRTLAEAGQTILVVEQNISAAMTLADRIYILNNGHMVEELTAQA